MKTISNSVSNTKPHDLAEEGRKVRDFIASNRSEALLRLFDYLLQQSIEGRRPKETEIAEEVFPGNLAASEGKGSQARVGIYRLRKKLDLYYADKPGARLVIPQGEYGFVIRSPDGAHVGEEDQAGGESRRPRFRRKIWLAASALILANAILAWFHFKDAATFRAPPPRSALWQFSEGMKSRTIIAIGDYFMFISKQNDEEQVVQDLSIDSADAFYEYVTKTSEARETLRNEDLQAVSSDILTAVGRLWTLFKDYQPLTVASSAVDPDMMKSSNIVYIGPLDAMTSLLSSPLFLASQFSCAATCYELIDKPSGQRFLSDSPYLLADRIVPRRDYGYIASFPGPSGNQILIVSGTGDAGVTQMVGIVADAKRLEELRQRVGGPLSSFEALYQVRTMFNQTYGSSLLMARSINADRIWEPAAKGGTTP